MERGPWVPHAADEGEAAVPVPAEHHAPGEGSPVAAVEAELGEIGEDAVAADQGALVRGELGDHDLVQGSLLLRRTGRVADAFGEIVAASGHVGSRR
jgi:hypothetical protein